jgi:methionyl-tRNA formyltransferase
MRTAVGDEGRSDCMNGRGGWILLTPEAEGPQLTAALTGAGADPAAVAVVSDRSGLEAALAARGPSVRLIGFCTGVIVRAAELAALSAPAYNFHPGPPAYPGLRPVSFALYDGATRFGVTAHEMAARVDSGPIVAAAAFNIPPKADFGWLSAETHRIAHALFRHIAPLLADLSRPLPHAPLTWSSRRCSAAAADALCRLPADIDAAELARRERAFGALGDLRVELHGRTFRQAPPASA